MLQRLLFVFFVQALLGLVGMMVCLVIDVFGNFWN